MRLPLLTNESYWTKTDAELAFILRDASEAARCVRGLDPKAEAKYLEQAADASTVVWHRVAGSTAALRRWREAN